MWITYNHPLITPLGHISVPDAGSRSPHRIAAWPVAAGNGSYFLFYFSTSQTSWHCLQQYLSVSWSHRRRRAHLAGFAWKYLFFSVINSSHLVNSNSKAVVQRKIPRLPESTPDWMWLAWTVAVGPPSSELSQVRAWVTWLGCFWTTKCIRELQSQTAKTGHAFFSLYIYHQHFKVTRNHRELLGHLCHWGTWNPERFNDLRKVTQHSETGSAV